MLLDWPDAGGRTGRLETEKNGGRRILFLKNKAGELLKTKDGPEKQTENKAETKLAKLLKPINTPKNRAKTNRKTKLAKLLKIQDSLKSNRKTNLKTAFPRLLPKT